MGFLFLKSPHISWSNKPSSIPVVTVKEPQIARNSLKLRNRVVTPPPSTQKIPPHTGDVPAAGVMLGTNPRNSKFNVDVGCSSPAATTAACLLGVHVCQPLCWVLREALFPLLRVEKQAAFSTNRVWFLIHKIFFLTYRSLDCKYFIKWLIYHACGLSRWALFITWKVLPVIPWSWYRNRENTLTWPRLSRRRQWVLRSWLGTTFRASMYHLFFLVGREKAGRNWWCLINDGHPCQLSDWCFSFHFPSPLLVELILVLL